MRSQVAQQIVMAFKALQSCNAHKQKAVGMIVSRLAQEQARSFAYKFAHPNANAAGLRDLSALKDINAD